MWYITPERELLRKTVREFAQKEIRPFIPELEKEAYPAEILKKLGRIGILGLCHDPGYGGSGVDYINWYLALEEIAKESHTVALLAVQTSDLCAHCAEGACTPAQVEKYIKPAVRGDIILGQWATEPSGMANVAEYETTAVRDGDGWVINGSKIFSTNAGACDYAMVICRTSDHADPVTLRGASMFIVSKDNPGLTIGHIEHKFGWHGSATGQTYFHNCLVSNDDLIGEVDECVPYLIGRVNPGLGFYGALALGAAEAVYAKTRAYLAGRIQGGKSLWNAHQVVRNQMSEMWMQIEQLRCAVYGYAETRMRGMEVTGLAIALKIEGTKLAKAVCDKCMTLHGGLGTVRETGIERYYRDVKMADVACGSNLTLTDALTYSL
jgi:butyryl-CoA dehydrogenase